MPKKILILFAHPRLEKSANNSALIRSIPDDNNITFHDLYEKYPDFNIDIESEKKLLSENDIIIWQHPFYWYSAPPLLKQWLDLVLEFGWAYGPGGEALKGKVVFNSITAGGQRSAYSTDGHNRFTIRELLAPFDQTAILCKMTYLPPFVVHGTHRISKEELHYSGQLYNKLLKQLLAGNYSVNEILKHKYLNNWIEFENEKTIVL
jgi:glutathione-regulated potassium-efflux system ancillary protein KefG